LEQVTMSHGAGGSVMMKMIKNHILKCLGGFKTEVPLEALDDSAVIDGIAFKSDSHAVKPIFFPGGNIGRLSVAGTVNDLAVIGAEPIALGLGLILEEGLPITDLDRILESIGDTCSEADVAVITGDTKVVEKGSLGGCVINTSGIGRRSEALESNILEIKKHRSFNKQWILDSNLEVGDKIILSGTIGDHGIAVLSAQQGYNFGSEISSDVAPLNRIIMKTLVVGGVVAMKDPTRGGLSNSLNELSEKSNVGIHVFEENIPIRGDVKTACEILGLDPLEIGNEGKVVIGAVPEKTEEILAALKKTKKGRNAQIIGEATREFDGVVLETTVGGTRILLPPIGDPIPRIC